MISFPTLSKKPSFRSYAETKAIDPTIRSSKEGGYVSTRPRFTRTPKKWSFGYRNITAADKGLLVTHEDAVKVGGAMFSWTNPVDGVSYNVRLASPIKFKHGASTEWWDADLELEQV